MLISVVALGACDSSSVRANSNDSKARIAAVQPHLANAASDASAMLSGARPCESPFPGYPGCERDNGQLLLLGPFSAGDKGAGTEVDGLLYLPDSQVVRPMTLWHFGGPGTPLGHGWHHVTAILSVD